MRTRTLNTGVIAASLASIGLTAVLASLSGRPPDHFARDPLAVMDAPFYVGLMSNLTAVFWMTSAGAAFVIAIVCWGKQGTRRGQAMLAAACTILLLGLDDLFMIHEEALQRNLGVPEKLTIGVYALISLTIAMMYRRQWSATPWGVLVLGAASFAAAIGIDILSSGFGWRIVIEDAFKLLGVGCILAWTLGTAQRWLVSSNSAGASSQTVVQ